MIDGPVLIPRLVDFFTDYLVYVYFFYGLAFFSMGLAVGLEARQASELSLARGAWLLSGFGITHAIHEWMEMFVLISGSTPPVLFEWVRVFVLAGSFWFLAGFGVRISLRGQRDPDYAARLTILAVVAFLMQVALVRLMYRPDPVAWVRAADVLARYSLGVPSGTLTSLALIRQRRAFDLGGRGQYGRDMVWAATAFAWYSIVGQSFPPRSIIFPSMFINAETFLNVIGIPVQVLRASMAGLMAVAIMRALRAFEAESQIRLERAHEAEQRGQAMLARLNLELQNAARELSLLYEASRLLTTSLDLETLLREAIAKIVGTVEPVTAGAIMARVGRERPVTYRAAYGYARQHAILKELGEAGETIDALFGIAPKWMAAGGEDVTSIISEGEPFPNSQAIEIQFVALPLETRETTLGYLVLETGIDGPYLSSSEAPTIVALASQLAIAIENAALLQETRLRDARRGELLQRITAAQEAERRRIARELHDETGQTLTGLGLALSSVEQLIRREPGQATSRVGELRDMCSQAIEELRRIINYLRPSQLDDLGLVAALRWYVEQVSARTETRIEFKVSGTQQRLSPEAETMLFRIAQEGLNNVVKHADATTATLRLEYGNGSVRLQVCDDGRGFDVGERLQPGARLAWGLVGIQERANLTGGRLEIESTPGEGTCLRLTIPLVLADEKERV